MKIRQNAKVFILALKLAYLYHLVGMKDIRVKTGQTGVITCIFRYERGRQALPKRVPTYFPVLKIINSF